MYNAERSRVTVTYLAVLLTARVSAVDHRARPSDEEAGRTAAQCNRRVLHEYFTTERLYIITRHSSVRRCSRPTAFVVARI